MPIPPYSIDVNGNDNQPEWGYCATPGCTEPAYPIWYSGSFPDDPDLLLCETHIGARMLELEADATALRAGIDTYLDTLVNGDPNAWRDARSQLHDLSSEGHPGARLLIALDRAETARKAAIQRGAADHAVVEAARAWRTAREALNGIAAAEATLLAAVAGAERGVSDE